jgi:hypothetical protein
MTWRVVQPGRGADFVRADGHLLVRFAARSRAFRHGGVVVTLTWLACACGRDPVCRIGSVQDPYFVASDSKYRDCVRRNEDDRRAQLQQEQDERACEGGAAEACLRAATFNTNALPDHSNDEQALSQYEVACRANLGEGCLGAGTLLLGHWIDKEPARAVALLLRACDLGVPRGCALAAEQHSDVVARAELDERACLLGHVSSCKKAADALLSADQSRARRLYEVGCRAEDSAACADLGRIEVGAQ